MTRKNELPNIKVIFDTNTIHTLEPGKLYRRAVADLIKSEAERKDLNVSWLIPDVALNERRYQMRAKSKKLHNEIMKLEKNFGYDLGVTLQDLNNKIESNIDMQLSQYSIEVINIDNTKVDLSKIINNSCHREPPFSEGESEKGFRDAIIAETLFQYVDKVNQTEPDCRVMFVTSDDRLSQHTKTKMESNKNVNIISSIDELKGSINAICSNISEREIARLQKECGNYFHNPRSKNSVYYNENIYDQLSQEYHKELHDFPPIDNYSRKNTTVKISKPQFQKKDRSVITWISKVIVDFEILKREQKTLGALFDSSKNLYTSEAWELPDRNIYDHNELGNIYALDNASNEASGEATYSSATIPSSAALDYYNNSNVFTQHASNTIAATGRTEFEIEWNVDINHRSGLTNHNIIAMRYIDTIWD